MNEGSTHVMRDPQICIELLEHLLPGRKIRNIEYLREKESDEQDGDNDMDDDADHEAIEYGQIKPETQKVLTGEYARRG
ncbi:MAG: hypothetical protein Q4D04_12950, partial [Clostridia bacterium]|nr:hypothetical protein [Clostridia bacterium]